MNYFIYLTVIILIIIIIIIIILIIIIKYIQVNITNELITTRSFKIKVIYNNY